MKPSVILNIALGVVAIALAVWAISERGAREKLASQIAVLESEAAGRAKAATSPTEPSKRAEKPGAPVPPKIAGGEATSAEAEKKKKDPVEAFTKGIAEMMDNPAMKDMMATQVRGMIEGTYKDLFDDLDLTEEQRKALVDALSERALAQQMQGLKLMNGAENKDQLKDIEKELKAGKQASDDKIKEILGDPASLERFQRYEDSQPERQQIGMLKGALTNAGEPLSVDQEEQLMAAMYRERKAFKFDHDYQDQTDMNPEKLSTEAIARYQDQSKQLDERIVNQAAEFLSEKQLESFRTTREQMHAMERMGLEMASKMFGLGKEGGKDDGAGAK